MTLATLLAILSFLNLTGSSAQKVAPKADATDKAVPTLTVCEALSHGQEYDGKLVRIRGRVVATGESSAFVGEDCPGIYVTDHKIWPSVVVWTMPSQSDFIIHPVDFTYSWDSDRTLQKKYDKLHKRFPHQCFAFTYTGMFEIWTKETARKPRGKVMVEISGFGHLNNAPAQLVVKSADDVTPAPNCTADK